MLACVNIGVLFLASNGGVVGVCCMLHFLSLHFSPFSSCLNDFRLYQSVESHRPSHPRLLPPLLASLSLLSSSCPFSSLRLISPPFSRQVLLPPYTSLSEKHVGSRRASQSLPSCKSPSLS
ncbi:hypothetical protein BKA57DRAFT_8133 [Linnemannia elongata]|nr:hypothetical protein BKA57DRAFT_8133 [Linnemannia elongata]